MGTKQALVLSRLAERIRPPERRLGEVGAQTAHLSTRLSGAMQQVISAQTQRVETIGKLLDANSFERVLERGFALVTDGDGRPLKRSKEAAIGADVMVRFADASRAARLDPDGPVTAKATPKQSPKKVGGAKQDNKRDSNQDSLF